MCDFYSKLGYFEGVAEEFGREVGEFRGKAVSSTSLFMTWNPVPNIHQNGIITQYQVEYNQTEFSEVLMFSNQIVSGDTLTTMLLNLEEYVTYTICVRAYTEVGSGPYSPIEEERTLEDGKSFN